ncbi:MAG: 3-phosphoshikimate 1-carboxyvinyltransferase [Candidatus Omnitrophica bacterium]|nr:3-phosphoshikimate 1-carboxyvinyltransferase [Candidatus Omnitrophota bacterium]
MRGKVFLPGDKSIAHRAIILSALAKAKTNLKNIPLNTDCLATIAVFRKLGVKIKLNKASCRATVSGRGLFGLNAPKGALYIKDSGTTFRLLLGVLAGQDFKARLMAGPSLSRRPMLRAIKPLRLMGAAIKARAIKKEEYPPVMIHGGNLNAINYKIPVPSAQVKSAILLAGLYAKGKTKIIEPLKTRDHTERMLKLFKANLKTQGKSITVSGAKKLISPGALYIPGDISSAAFFMVAASIIPGAKILIKNVSLNPGRVGIIKALKRMGAALKIENSKLKTQGNEPMGDILVKSSCLRGIKIGRKEVPSLIDELPILMVAACFAKGKSIFAGVGELRVKETDRIKSMLVNLAKMGAKIRVVKSGGQENIIIQGAKVLYSARVSSFGDHRTAMSMVIAGLAARGKTRIDDISCINKSFPGFLTTLKSLNIYK